MHGQGWNGLKARTYGEPGRMGRRASNMSLGANGTLIPITGVIGDNGIFPVTDRTLFKGRDGSCRYPFTGNAVSVSHTVYARTERDAGRARLDRRLTAVWAANRTTIQDVPLEVGHASVPTNNGNGTIPQRFVYSPL